MDLQEIVKKVTSKILREYQTASEENHNDMMNVMRGFMDKDDPQVGIFWYNYHNNSLFGVMKDDASKYILKKGDNTYPKLHKQYWQKQHQRALARKDKNSIFYGENNYTLIPRGRLFVEPTGHVYVVVGDWINGFVNGEKVIDGQKVRDLIADEFNLPDDFEIRLDSHWDIGKGWSEEKF